ncbi:hypothetical protein MHBO_003475 [Bonamia ostreae]|uniref:Uncharacterized protein n=1 Tax=Bonamia ostreae TaxID=126728 RepID=A0ABV2AQL1_9EUKA
MRSVPRSQLDFKKFTFNQEFYTRGIVMCRDMLIFAIGFSPFVLGISYRYYFDEKNKKDSWYSQSATEMKEIQLGT